MMMFLRQKLRLKTIDEVSLTQSLCLVGLLKIAFAVMSWIPFCLVTLRIWLTSPCHLENMFQRTQTTLSYLVEGSTETATI
jgi:hypothetical protein